MRFISSGEASRDPRHLRSGAWLLSALGIIIFFFVGLGIWASTLTIMGAVIAQGTVDPESGIKAVQHPEGGVVKAIHVKEGDAVRAGQVLIMLDDTTLRASLAAVDARFVAALAEVARLQAERDNAAEVDFPDELLQHEQSARARALMNTQLSLFRVRRTMLASQLETLDQKIQALQERMKGLREELAGTSEQMALVREEIATVEALLRKGQALKPRLLALRRTAASLAGEKGRLRGELAQAQKAIAEIRAQSLALKRDFLSRVLARLAELQKEIAILREQRADLQKKLEETRIRAPSSGRILDLQVRTVGGVIAPRQPILYVVPDKEPLIVDARVRTTDIDEVTPQAGARVVISAFSSSNAPTLHGHVRIISPAPQLDALTKQPFYKVQVVVPANELRKLGPDRHLVPGMPAEVFITTRERTPLDILLSPFFNAMRRALRS